MLPVSSTPLLVFRQRTRSKRSLPSSATSSVSIRSSIARVVFDAADQVSRHAFGQTGGADEHVDAPGRLREEHGRLAPPSFRRR